MNAPSRPAALGFLALLTTVAALPGQCGVGRPDLLLPRIGTVGDLPPPRATLDISIRRDGTLWHEGRRVDFDELVALMKRGVVAQPRARLPIGPDFFISDLNLLLRADRDLPYDAIQRILERCCHPNMGIWRIFFAVHSDSGGEDGAIGLFLPFDIDSSFLREPDDQEVVTLGGDGEPSDPSGLYPVIRKWLRLLDDPPRVANASITIEPAGDVPLRWVLETADASFRAGLRRIYLGGEPTEAQKQSWSDPVTARDVTALVRCSPRRDQPPGVRIGPLVIPAARVRMPLAVRTRGAYAGLVFKTEVPFLPPSPPPPEPSSEELPVLQDPEIVEIVEPGRVK